MEEWGSLVVGGNRWSELFADRWGHLDTDCHWLVEAEP